ncbi:MAG: YiiX family permuted papain-like enzyme [Spirochaetales bacterium]|nr:YiiX family permuted papain-like enzyme [Spirochaetales bacterium]
MNRLKKITKRKSILFSIIICLLMTIHCNQENILQNGDIIFQDLDSEYGKAIKVATHSEYDHVGIIYVENDTIYVFEALGTVKLTPLDKWIKQNKNSHYVVKRLKNSTTYLTPGILKEMKNVGESYNGKAYDLYYGWADDSLYCSELVWKIYFKGAGIKLCKPRKLKDYNIDDPHVKKMLKMRYGNNIPFEEYMVAPQDIFESQKLVTIIE